MKKLFALAVLISATFSISCSQTTANESIVGNQAKPAIKFNELEHDYGTIEQGGNGTYAFEFINEGDAPLVLTNVRSSCGCTIPEWPKEPIEAGNGASIIVKYDTRRIGNFAKTVYVSSNATEKPVLLRIKGKVEPKVAAN